MKLGKSITRNGRIQSKSFLLGDEHFPFPILLQGFALGALRVFVDK